MPQSAEHTQTHPPETLPYGQWNQLMMDFFRQGGNIARKWQRQITPTRKADKSVVTEADLEVSALAQRIFAPLRESGHLILDEETIADAGAPSADIFANHDFIWAIDPIDGTKAYTMGLPTYAISAGLLYKGRPLMGGVYLPKTDELFVHDGQKAMMVENPFSTTTHTENLAVPKTFQRRMLFDVVSNGCADLYHPQSLPCDLTASNASATALAFVAAGRTNGCFFRHCLWDMAGAWPLLVSSGAQLLRLSDGQPLTRMTHTELDENWQIKEPYIACNPDFYQNFEMASNTQK